VLFRKGITRVQLESDSGLYLGCTRTFSGDLYKANLWPPILSVIMLSVIMLSVIMLSVIMLSLIMLSVIMLCVILLIVLAQKHTSNFPMDQPISTMQ
jgi:hypothetical protein